MGIMQVNYPSIYIFGWKPDLELWEKHVKYQFSKRNVKFKSLKDWHCLLLQAGLVRAECMWQILGYHLVFLHSMNSYQSTYVFWIGLDNVNRKNHSSEVFFPWKFIRVLNDTIAFKINWKHSITYSYVDNFALLTQCLF